MQPEAGLETIGRDRTEKPEPGEPSAWRATPLPPTLEGPSEKVGTKGNFYGQDLGCDACS